MYLKTLGNTSTKIAAIGQGTDIRKPSHVWPSLQRQSDIIKLGIDLGMTFIDTAPRYGNGQAEKAAGRAVRGVREKVFLATKVSPGDIAYGGVINSAQASLRRLKTDYIDLYQVHWPNPSVPIRETMGAMQRLVEEGKVRHVGVSNFSLKEMREAQASFPVGEIVSTQVEYNLFDRSIEDEVLPHCEKRAVTLVAYSPLHRARVANGVQRLTALQGVAEKYQKTIAQVALRWIISHGPVIAIPSTTNPEHLRENAASADFDLLDEDIREIDSVCSMKPVPVPVASIRVAAISGRQVYKTLEEAKKNHLNSAPSPVELAQQIREGQFLKPVRLVSIGQSKNEYELVEGRIRYWAWVIAHDGKKPIPALVDDPDERDSG